MKRHGKSGRPGKRRRNMPGYYLGINKIGRKSWFASRRPQDLDGYANRYDFASGRVKVGTLFALSKTSNAIFLGMHRGRVLYYNPKTDRVGHTGFGRFRGEVRVPLLKERVGLEYFKSENNWMNHRKIPGSDLRVSDVLVNPYRKTIAKKVGDEFTMLDYHESAVVGDVLYGQQSGLKAEVISITKRGMNVKVFDGTPGGKIGHINLKNRAFRDRKYTLVKSAVNQDVKIEDLQKKIKDVSFDTVQTENGGSVAVGRGRPAGSTNRPLTEEEKQAHRDKAEKHITKLDKVADEAVRDQLDLVKKIISHSNRAGDEETNKKYKKLRQQLLYKIGLHDKYDEAETPEQKLEAAKAALKYERRIGGRESAIKMWENRINALKGKKDTSEEPEKTNNKKTEEATDSKNTENKKDSDKPSFESRVSALFERFKDHHAFIRESNIGYSQLNDGTLDRRIKWFEDNLEERAEFYLSKEGLERLGKVSLASYLGEYKSLRNELARRRRQETNETSEDNNNENKNTQDNSKKNKEQGNNTGRKILDEIELESSEGADPNFLPKFKFNEYNRLTSSDLNSIQPGEKLFAYDNFSNKIIEVTKDSDGYFRTPVMEKGVPSKDAFISVNLRDGKNIPLTKVNQSNIGSNDKLWHNLTVGDWINVTSGNDTGLYKVTGFDQQGPLLSDKNGNRYIGNSSTLLSNDFKAIPTPKSSTSALNVIRNLEGQTHLVTHTDKGNLPLGIRNYEVDYDEESNSLKVKLSLEDPNGRIHNIEVVKDKISKNNIFNVDTSISSMLLKENLFGSDNTIAGKLKTYGAAKAMSHMCVPGANNFISLSGTNGSVNFVNSPQINGDNAGLIRREFGTNYSRNGSKNTYMYNALFQLPSALQGGGTAQRLYDNQVKLGKMLGMSYFKMTCALTVGGYAWATRKKGFNFVSSSEARAFRISFINKIQRLSLDDWREFHPAATLEVMKQQKDEIIKRLEARKLDANGNPTNEYYYDTAKAHEFAEFTHSYTDENGNVVKVGAKRMSSFPDIDNRLHHIGKAFMLGSFWHGKKSLKKAEYNNKKWDISTIEASVPDVAQEVV